MQPHEPIVTFATPMPRGYTFIRKGDIYITKNCRKLTQEAHSTVYQVQDRNGRVQGIRVPTTIWTRVQAMDTQTRASRAAVVARTDSSTREKLEREVQTQFPRLPADNLPQILDHALKKRSGRVARTKTMELSERVWLAVRAHIRHVHTDYEMLMRNGAERNDARSRVQAVVDGKVQEWGGNPIRVASRQRRPPKKRSNVQKKAPIPRRHAGQSVEPAAETGSAVNPIVLLEDTDETMDDEQFTSDSSQADLSDIEWLPFDDKVGTNTRQKGTRSDDSFWDAMEID